MKYTLEFDREFYLNDPTFENRPLRSIEPELIEFSDDPEDLAAELAYTRHYLAKEEAKVNRLVDVLEKAVEWIGVDPAGKDFLQDWACDADRLLAGLRKETEEA